MAEYKILVVEDEADIIDLITYNLKQEGYKIISTSSGETALDIVKADNPDLILLDIMLPGLNGIDVCREIKSDTETSHIPIIMLTARNEDIDIITGLEVGADDYITKPFSPRVLIARIRAMFRRQKVAVEDDKAAFINYGEIKIDTGRHKISIGEKNIDLTFTEFRILEILARRPGWVLSRSQLIDQIRDGQHIITDRAIDVQIANLRRKLGRYGDTIETVRGMGYRMREEK